MKLKILVAVCLTTALFALLMAVVPSSSSASSKDKKQDDGRPVPHTKGKMRLYPNDVIKVEPDNFAVTPPLRELPDSRSYPPDAFRKGGQVIRERRMQRLRKERRKQGLPPLTAAEEQEVEINWRNARRIKRPVPGAGAGFAEFSDPVLRAVDPNSPQAMPTPSLTFDGATQLDNSNAGAGLVTPPDVNGDVGPNHYVSSVNLSIKIFNKNGAALAPAKKTSDLFASLPSGDPCRSRNDGDPIVIYDSLADRWFITQFSTPGDDGIGSSNYECVAVSQTADPTGNYYVWSYQYPNSLFNDYPKVGVWPDAYHMTFNQFDNLGSGGGWRGLGILSQDRMRALAGDPDTPVVYKNIASIDPNAGGALPADVDGLTPPPAGMAQVIAEFRANEYGDPNDAVRLYRWVPDFNNPTGSSLTVLNDTVLAAFDARYPDVTGGTVEQLGGTALDGIADRMMYRFAYRNLGTYSSPVSSYVGSFTVNVSGVDPTASISLYQAGIRWFELRRTSDTFTVRDQGTHATGTIDGDAGLNNWIPSIAQDNAGNIALGFSQAGKNQNPDIKVAGRTGTATGGGLNEGEALLWDGLGSQTSGFRWGDYSMMSVDPTDDCSFWYTSEYYAANAASNWSTRVGKFKFPGCTAAQKGTVSGTITSCSTGQPLSGAVVLANGGYQRFTATGGTYSMTVVPGNYSISANKSSGYIGESVPVNVTNGGAATANICLTGTAVATAGTVSITSESCGVANGRPDPGEQLTVSLPVSNTGGGSTTNLVATLQATGGVSSSVAQTYGSISPGAPAVSRDFTFTVNPSHVCGNSVTLTWVLTDGASNLGTVTKTYPTGTPVTAISQNFDAVTSPALPASWSSVQTFGTGISWVTTSTTPVSSSPNAAFANSPATINAAALVTPSISITSSPAAISFKKSYLLEDGYDGTVLEMKIGAGEWQDIISAGGTFVAGGYDAAISSDFGSRIAGRSAWTGSSTSYSATEVALPSGAAGQSVQFRWLVASDNGNDSLSVGFRVDDIAVTAGATCNSCQSSPGSIAGTVRYYFGASPLAVPSVTLTASGSPEVIGQSGATGTYTLPGLGSGAYTVTPSKSGQVAGISSLDASRAAQFAVGLITLTANQQIAADATNNGSVSSLDASRIAQTAAGITNPGIAGAWKFSPASKAYSSVNSSVTGQDFEAILVGDVTGNWAPPPGAAESAADDLTPLTQQQVPKAEGIPGILGSGMYSWPETSEQKGGRRGGTPVRLGLPISVSAESDATVSVPVSAEDLTGLGVTAFDLELDYDSGLLRPLGIESGSRSSSLSGWTVTFNDRIPGRMRISAFGIFPLSGSGDLLTLKFEAIRPFNRSTPVRWRSLSLNEGEVPASAPGKVFPNPSRGPRRR